MTAPDAPPEKACEACFGQFSDVEDDYRAEDMNSLAEAHHVLLAERTKERDLYRMAFEHLAKRNLENAQEWRNDWSDFDGRTLLSQVREYEAEARRLLEAGGKAKP
jgi:hypothetical protein